MTRVAWRSARRCVRPAARCAATKVSPSIFKRGTGMKSPVSGKRPNLPASSAEDGERLSAMPTGGCGFCTQSGFHHALADPERAVVIDRLLAVPQFEDQLDRRVHHLARLVEIE